jgi:glycosyltransferase involved in cell wall biosynthesis
MFSFLLFKEKNKVEEDNNNLDVFTNKINEYSISSLIDKYGAERYLKCLHSRYQKGLYDTEQYCKVAANAYLYINKPYRAIALLYSYEFMSKEWYLELKKKVSEACQKTECRSSLNMIVKNEEKNIRTALESVDDIMDEIIICDTGSDDATCEIAKQYGVKIIFDPWENNFSKPRNKALFASKGKWIFWIDADDIVDKDSKKYLVEIFNSSNFHAAGICVQNILNGLKGPEFVQIRIFPNVDGVIFERKIHEQVAPSLFKLGYSYIVHSKIKVFHYGYNDPYIDKIKAQRNEPLILEEIKKNPDSITLMLNLGDCYSILGKQKEALKIYKKITKMPDAVKNNRDIFVQAHFNIAHIYKLQNNLKKSEEWLIKTIKLDSTRAEAFFLLGGIAEENKDFDKAFDYFLTCSKIKSPLRQTATDSINLRINATYKVAEYLFKKGFYEECIKLLESAVSVYPNVVDYYNLLGKALLCIDSLAKAARYFMLSLCLCKENNCEAKNGMAFIFRNLGDIKKAEEILKYK